jgi:hypothetical protein
MALAMAARAETIAWSGVSDALCGRPFVPLTNVGCAHANDPSGER